MDQSVAAMVDADGDGLLDVIFSSRDGYVLALKGTNGNLLWQHQTGRIMESGPMIADLEGDGSLEVIQAADCLLAGCPPGGALFVYAADPPGTSVENPSLWQVAFPWKSDSGEPAIADLDPDDGRTKKAIVVPTWGGKLLVLWKGGDGAIVQNEFDLRTIDNSIPAESHSVVIRSSPLLADFREGMTAVFGWMPDWQDYTWARLSAVGIRADMAAGTVKFTPRWTEPDLDWKSSPALIPVPSQSPLIVSGLGYAIAPSGGFGCIDVFGGFVARNGRTGSLAWEFILPEGTGVVRGSVAVADLDGDNRLEVLGVVGCGGNLIAFHALTGALEWELKLGEITFVSPSLGDLDGDGLLEILVGSYDGKVYAPEGGS